MKNDTLFALICAVSISLATFATAVPLRPRPIAVSRAKINDVKSANDMIEALTRLQKLGVLSGEQGTRHWLTDLIWYLLGLTCGELLSSVNTTLEQLSLLITRGVEQLQETMNAVDPATKEEIQRIINQALEEAIKNLNPLLEDLEIVLPIITKTWYPLDAADLIEQLLNMSLEDFLNGIARVLEQSDALLVNTIQGLKDIADRVEDPDVSGDLHETSDECLDKGRAVIRPILDKLYQVLPTSVHLEPIEAIPSIVD